MILLELSRNSTKRRRVYVFAFLLVVVVCARRKCARTRINVLELVLNRESSYSIQVNPTMGWLLLIKYGHALLLRGRAER